MLQYLEHCLGGVPDVGILKQRQVCVIEDGDDLVLEGNVNGSKLVVYLSCIRVFAKDYISLTCWFPLWSEVCAAWVGRELEY